MLAPRKKLWSTPHEVVDRAIPELGLTADDILFDVGAGDGRLLVKCALMSEARCIGVEIDEERAAEAMQALDRPIRVVSYMSPLPGEVAEKVIKVSTASHPGAEWPLFIYRLNYHPDAPQENADIIEQVNSATLLVERTEKKQEAERSSMKPTP